MRTKKLLQFKRSFRSNISENICSEKIRRSLTVISMTVFLKQNLLAKTNHFTKKSSPTQVSPILWNTCERMLLIIIYFPSSTNKSRCMIIWKQLFLCLKKQFLRKFLGKQKRWISLLVILHRPKTYNFSAVLIHSCFQDNGTVYTSVRSNSQVSVEQPL